MTDPFHPLDSACIKKSSLSTVSRYGRHLKIAHVPLRNSDSLTRSFGFLTQTTRAYNPVRRTFYDVNYIYARVVCVKNPNERGTSE